MLPELSITLPETSIVQASLMTIVIYDHHVTDDRCQYLKKYWSMTAGANKLECFVPGKFFHASLIFVCLAKGLRHCRPGHHITKLSMTALRIIGFFATLSINDTQHNSILTALQNYAECRV